jgi:hypothetical protein
MIMGARARLAGASARRPVIIAIASLTIAALVTGATVAIVRDTGGSATKNAAPTPVALGVVSGGPNRQLGAAAVATLAALLRLPVRLPTHCADVSGQYQDDGPHIWNFRTQLVAFLRTSGASGVETVESTLNRSRDVSYWVYEPPDAVFAESQRIATCSAALPAVAFPGTFRIALHSHDRTTADALAALLRGLGPVGSTSCSACSRRFVRSPAPTGSMSP